MVVLLCVALASAVLMPPRVQALPEFSTVTWYYTSSHDANGWSYRSCTGSWQQEGTLAGEWKEVDIQYCEYPYDFIIEYYHYCSGHWVQVDYLFDPSC
jgi:hypothetical protein